MNKLIFLLLLGLMTAGLISIRHEAADGSDSRRPIDLDRSISKRPRDIPGHEMFPLQEGSKIETLDQAAPVVAAAVLNAGSISGQDGMRDQKPHQEPTPLQRGPSADNGLDADNFLWGTEVYMQNLKTSANDILTTILPVRYLKVRFQINFFSAEEGKTFSPEACMPSPSKCVARFNTDDLADTFKARGWSMIPMFSHDRVKVITSEDIESYVNYVDWFVSRYRTDANIRYVELVNAPVSWWKGTKEQLAELNNKVYERIKGKYPDIMVGTPGFEYWVDTTRDDKSVQEIEFFLDKRNNVKFDFWAFHGYPAVDFDSIAVKKIAAFYPPSKKTVENKYAGPAGIMEIRKKLDANGWIDRVIIDSEHTNIMSKAKPFVSDDEDILDVAYTVQELVIKRTLTVNGRPALRGIIPLKIGPRGNRGEFLFASLKPDGSPTMTVRAVGILVSKLKEFNYSSHVSGEFDVENQPWIEKFTSARKELYVYFKPFIFQKGREIAFDGQAVTYKLTFSRKPGAIVLTSATGKVSYPPPGPFIILEATNTPQYLEVRYDEPL